MSSDPQVRKDLLKYLLMQVKRKELDAGRAKEFMKAIGEPEPKRADPVAVVGIACRFPGAPDKERFWSNLVDGRESIGDFPAARIDDMRRVEGGSAQVRKGGYLDRIDLFDPEYFGIPPQVARQLDPYHRNLMEVLVETMEDAGYPKSALYGSNVGIFVGNDHTHRLITSYLPFLSELDFSAITGSWSGILASRLAYHLNLTGPATVIDTGCSSGLVALDAAMKAIRHGDCDTAFVAAANLFLSPSSLGNETESGDYRVRAFDAAANGTVWSEGVAGIYVKPLSQALKDHDHVYGVILGSAVNNDGRSNGLTAPNAQAQKELLITAWKRAGIPPESLSYVEAHGTGTALGDPIELKGLTSAFGAFTSKRQFCALGSVKTNIGHTVGAAGLASLIKTLMALDRRVIPPSINFDVPNPYLDLAESPVYVTDRVAPWEPGEMPRRAGVSSFSLSGTNCHVVLEEAPVRAERSAVVPSSVVYPISARRNDLLTRTAAIHLAFLDDHPEYRLDDVCFTMQVGREHQRARAVILCETREGLREGLTRLSQGSADVQVESLADGQTVIVRAPGETPAADSGAQESGETPPADAGTARGIDLPDRFRHLAGVVSDYLQGRERFADLRREVSARRVPLPPQLFDHVRLWDEDARPTTATTVATGEESAPGTAGWIRGILAQGSTPDAVTDHHPAQAVIAAVWSDVLGYPTINSTDDFFTLGGDSIGSLKIIQMLNSTFDLDIPTSALLAEPVFADFAATVIGDFGLDDARVVERSNSQDPRAAQAHEAAEEYELPLTAAQRSMFLSSRLDDDSVAYNISGLAIGQAKHDVAALEAGLRVLVRRHDSLRSTFHLVHGEPIQRVHADVPVAVEVRRLGGLADGESHESRVKAQMAKFVQPFRLDEGPLFRVGYFEFDDGVSCVAIDIHHIITDGASMEILFRDLAAAIDGETLPRLDRSYRSAVRDLLSRQTEVDLLPHRNYWVARFADQVPTLQLPTDWQRPEVAASAGAMFFATLDADLLERAKRYARDHDLTLYMVLLGVFHQLLAKMSGQSDIVIGTPVMGRPDLSYHNLVGMFVNTLALRITGDPVGSVSDYFADLKAVTLGAYEHQSYPLDYLIEELDPLREPGRRPMFDVYFAHQNIDMGQEHDGEQYILFDDGSTKFDLTLSTREADGGLLMEWEYSTTLFRPETIELFAQRYVTLLRSVLAAENDDCLGGLELLSARERELIRKFATSPAPPPESLGVVGLFQRHVTAAPDATALIMGEERLSYREVDDAANRVAHDLMQRGCTAGSPVALLLDRSFDMIIAILGALKARCVYVPLNTEFPAERLQMMVGDSGARILLSAGACLRRAGELVSDRLEVVDLQSLPEPTSEIADPCVNSSSDDPIYIMYTSGTTGVPKGSLIRQRGVLRVAHRANFADADPSDVFLMLSDYSFDGSVYDMFGALTNGASLVIMDKESVLDFERLGAAIEQHRVTRFFITTAMFNALIDIAPEALRGVRRIVFGGEIVSPVHVQKAFDLLGPGRIAHAYGPTETTVFATVHVLDGVDDNDTIPIGRAVNDTSLWVLDEHRELVPIGARGELYIGGAGLADGYLNQSDLTAQRFVTSPAVPGERLYKTGDLVCFKSNGELYYSTRIDQQVKLRGYRIELAEIMHAALDEPYIGSAHAGVYETGEGSKSLCLWVRYTDGSDHDESRLRAALQRRLPSYMVPSFIVATDELRLNKNGKVDVTALPEPVQASDGSASSPVTESQQRIVEAWSRVLGLTVDDIDANFFALGGDSIKAIQIVAKLKEHGIAIRVTDLLENQTVRLLDEKLGDSSRPGTDVTVYDQTPVSGPVTASPIQQEFLDDSRNWSRVFNQSLLVTLAEPVPPEQVIVAVERLVRYHDMLRTQIDDVGGLRIRPVDAEPLVHSEHVPETLPATDLLQYLRSVQARVDVVGGPVVAVATGLEHGRQFMMAIHHLAVDVVSWTVLIDDLMACLADASADLPPKTMSFPSWSADLKRHAEVGGFRGQLPHWIDVARGAREAGDLFGERELRRGDSAEELVQVDESDASALFDTTREHYGLDPGQTLVAIIARALARWSGRDRVLFTLEGHGRERFADDHDLSRTVGWFTSTFPHLIEVEDSAEGTVETVRRSFDRLPDKGFGFGPLLRLDPGLGDQESLLASIRPQVSFNYLGEQDSQSDGIRIDHLPADVTVDEEHRSPHVLDIIASRRSGDVLIELRFPRQWQDNGSAGAVAKAITTSFHEVREAMAARADGTFRMSPSIRKDVLDDILVDIIGEG